MPDPIYPDIQKPKRTWLSSALKGTAAGILGGGVLGAEAGELFHLALPEGGPNAGSWQRDVSYGAGGGAGLGALIGALAGYSSSGPSSNPEYKTKHDEWMSGGVHKGNPVGRAVSSTVGRVGNFLTGGPMLTWDLLKNPEIEETKRVYDEMKSVRPQELKNTRIHLGGPNFSSELYRTLANPRNSILGKAMGAAGLPIMAAMTPLFRSNHYNPFSDTVGEYARNQAITSHELGHAIDFNKREPHKNPVIREGQGLLRDAYMRAYMPPFFLHHEAQANRKSWKALEEAHKDNPTRLRQFEIERNNVLPAAYATYLSAATGGIVNPLFSMRIGHGYGNALNLKVNKDWEEKLEKMSPKELKQTMKAFEESNKKYQKPEHEKKSSSIPVNIKVAAFMAVLKWAN